MALFSEHELELELIEQFEGLGYAYLAPGDVEPDGSCSERGDWGETVLVARLKDAAVRINPEVPEETLDSAIRRFTADTLPNLLEENRRVHKLLVEGIPVEYHFADGTLRGDRVYLVDFDEPENNDWLVLNQFTVIERGHNRRPDVVVFVNGLPLAVIELKNPADESASVSTAIAQLQTYKTEIPSLFHTNAVLIVSDGIQARIGSLSADIDRFMPWHRENSAADGEVIYQQEVLIEGVFDKQRLLSLIRDFTVFGSDRGGGIKKIIAGYHQFYAVNRAVEATLHALPKEEGGVLLKKGGGPIPTEIRQMPEVYNLPSARKHPEGDRRIGVIWHTQGSGKSLVMAFYAGLIVQRPELQNPTVVVITDRNDLDDQLFGTFVMCQDILRQQPVQAKDQKDLRRLLCGKEVGGVVFTTIQKFTPEGDEKDYPELTNRSNVVVIADEAHRTQYGLDAKVNRKSGKFTYGFAKYLRDALPNASFIGFTGTPIELNDANTKVIFGDYIDVYDISSAVKDKATVPIYYESRLARIELPEENKLTVDAEMEEYEDAPAVVQRALDKLIGSEERLALIAGDLIEHFEARLSSMEGKGMIVCTNRRICFDFYNAIIKLRPKWHSDDDMKGAIKIVMTGSASDPTAWQPHMRSKGKQDVIANRLRDPEDELKLVIVRDMWLTGFDAPPVHTMYVDKYMKGHNLMQAIARVNRVFKDKQGGLVVDYIGIGQSLKDALKQYTPSNSGNIGIDASEAVAVMLEKYDIVKSMFHGFDYQSALVGDKKKLLAVLADAINWILGYQEKEARKKSSDEDKKKAQRIYRDAALALSRAFSLAAASDEARAIRDEVAFFQAIRATLVKKSAGTIGSNVAEAAIQQIIDKAIVSNKIVDIMEVAGFDRPDISILSDEFLEEIKGMKRKNLALEALRRLLNDKIRSRSKINVTEAKKFSEQLVAAIERYHINALSTIEVINELIDIAKSIREAQKRGEEDGLSQEEMAFYDALAENESAVQAMGDEKLKVIAQELLNMLKNNIPIDWHRRESSRSKIRVLIKRALRKWGYPPDMQDEAVKTVLKQAEALTEELLQQ